MCFTAWDRLSLLISKTISKVYDAPSCIFVKCSFKLIRLSCFIAEKLSLPKRFVELHFRNTRVFLIFLRCVKIWCSKRRSTKTDRNAKATSRKKDSDLVILSSSVPFSHNSHRFFHRYGEFLTKNLSQWLESSRHCEESTQLRILSLFNVFRTIFPTTVQRILVFERFWKMKVVAFVCLCWSLLLQQVWIDRLSFECGFLFVVEYRYSCCATYGEPCYPSNIYRPRCYTSEYTCKTKCKSNSPYPYRRKMMSFSDEVQETEIGA